MSSVYDPHPDGVERLLFDLTQNVLAEVRLVDRRCRCGRLLTEEVRTCQWHAWSSAWYAAQLLDMLCALYPELNNTRLPRSGDPTNPGVDTPKIGG